MRLGDGDEVIINEDDLLGLLQRLGADGLAHSKRNLLTHLYGVYSLLKDWGNSPSVCLAGLFHSIYGTTFFTKTAAQLTQREEIRTHIGAAAENLVYLFCACDRAHLISQMTVDYKESKKNILVESVEALVERKFEVADRFAHSLVEVSFEVYRDLMEMVVANWAEQYYNPKKKADNNNSETRMKTHEKSMRTWSNAKHFLSDRGYAALQTLFEDQNNTIRLLQQKEMAVAQKKPKTTTKPKATGAELIGRRVKVHSKEDDEYRKGEIKDYDETNDLYSILYDEDDDGEEEWECRSDFVLLLPMKQRPVEETETPRKAKAAKDTKSKQYFNQKVPLTGETIELRQPPAMQQDEGAVTPSVEAKDIPLGDSYANKGHSLLKLRPLSSYPRQGPNHVARLLICGLGSWLCAVYCFYMWDYHSLIGSMFFSSLYVSPCFISLYVAFYQILKTRTLAITLPGQADSPVIVSVTSFESPTRLQNRFWKLFPSINGKPIIGICEENTAAVERSIIPLSMISYYALDCYNQITYEILTEDEECSLPDVAKSYPIHSLLDADQMKRFEPSFDQQNISDAAGIKQTRAEFCKELSRRGYAIIKVPNTFRYWKEIRSAINASNDWFYSLNLTEKCKCCYKGGGKQGVLLGYKKELGREFVEIRAPGKKIQKKMKWWPSNKEHKIIKGEKVDETLVKHAYEVFSLQHNFAIDMLDILMEGMGIEPRVLSQYLQEYPLEDNSVSACMYRLYRYNSNISTWWKKLPIIEQFFQSPPHSDLGLVTVGPRSAMPGLQAVDMVVKDKGGRGKWIDIEKLMDEDDVAVFVGNTMGHVSNGYYRPMLHKVSRPSNKDRFSLPFFLRFPDSAIVPNVVDSKRRTIIKNINRGVNARRGQLGWRNPVVRFLKAKKWIKTQTTFVAH